MWLTTEKSVCVMSCVTTVKMAGERPCDQFQTAVNPEFHLLPFNGTKNSTTLNIHIKSFTTGTFVTY